jgi:SAM-dependent methyltransferase
MTGLIARTFRRVGHLSTRARQRVRGVPLRCRNRSAGMPIPPSRLIRLVAGTEDVAWFLDSGAVAADWLDGLLRRNGVELQRLGSLLDFGCGVGRVIRHWSALDGPTVYGTDYNPDLIAWCREHLTFAHFLHNTLDGPIGLPGGSVDFAYALSVFTHLSEDGQRRWMGELRRVLRPGGLLCFTTHGDCYLPVLSPEEQDRYRQDQLVVKGVTREGSNHCAAFHPHSYVCRSMLDGFELIDFEAEGARGNPRQDGYLVRKCS